MKIIGLVGPKGAGKDTVFEILQELKKSDGKLSFALPLKQICAHVFDLNNYHMNDPVGKERPFETPITLTNRNLRAVKNACTEYLDPLSKDGAQYLYNPNKASVSGLEGRVMSSPRELLQVIGTDFIRNQLFQDWHLHAAFTPRALKQVSQDGVYCVTDIRFLNEYQFLVDKFGDDFTCYYVDRPEAEERLATATHASELESQKIKALIPEENIIKNDGTMKELTETLKALKIDRPDPSQKPKKGSRFKYGKA